MRARVALILTILGLAMAVIAAPVAAGGGSISIGNQGADGELGGGFSMVTVPGTWNSDPFCDTGFQVVVPGVVSQEWRFALELPLSGLPANATVTGATLGVRSISGAQAGQTAIYGYAGDGSISAADVQVTGTPVLFTPVTAGREDHDVTSLVTSAVVSAGWAGFSFRQDPLVDSFSWGWECPNTDIYPILTITYDLPNPPTPVASNLPNAAVAEPTATNPATALAFTGLLIGSLGTLAAVSSRRAVSRQ